MANKITSQEIIRAILSEREDQIVSTLTEGEVLMPYLRRTFEADMTASETVVSKCTQATKWEILTSQGIINTKGSVTKLDLTRCQPMMSPELRRLYTESVRENTHTHTYTPDNKDARAITTHLIGEGAE